MERVIHIRPHWPIIVAQEWNLCHDFFMDFRLERLGLREDYGEGGDADRASRSERTDPSLLSPWNKDRRRRRGGFPHTRQSKMLGVMAERPTKPMLGMTIVPFPRGDSS